MLKHHSHDLKHPTTYTNWESHGGLPKHQTPSDAHICAVNLQRIFGCHEILQRDSNQPYSPPVYQTIEVVDLDPLPADDMTVTGYSGTDCSGSSSAFSPGVNNGCAEMPDAFQEIITACSDSGAAPR